MFQLWKVVLLCGLLTGTSASPLESVPEDLGGSANRATPTLDGGLNALDNTLEGELTEVITGGNQKPTF